VKEKGADKKHTEQQTYISETYGNDRTELVEDRFRGEARGMPSSSSGTEMTANVNDGDGRATAERSYKPATMQLKFSRLYGLV